MEQNKISYLVIGGHGTETSLVFNESRLGESLGVISKDNVSAPGHKKTRSFLSEDASVILFSCSAGAEDGLAETISNKLDVKTFAPKITVSEIVVKAKLSPKGSPVFHVSYPENELDHGDSIRGEY